MASRTTPDPTPALVKGEHNPFVTQMLQAASDLSDEKDALMARIKANREVLRNMKTQGFVDDEQSAAIDEWYPVRERKGKGSSNGQVAAGDAAAAAPDAAAAT